MATRNIEQGHMTDTRLEEGMADGNVQAAVDLLCLLLQGDDEAVDRFESQPGRARLLLQLVETAGYECAQEECPSDPDYERYARSVILLDRAIEVASHLVVCPKCKARGRLGDQLDRLELDEDTRWEPSVRQFEEWEAVRPLAQRLTDAVRAELTRPEDLSAMAITRTVSRVPNPGSTGTSGPAERGEAIETLLTLFRDAVQRRESVGVVVREDEVGGGVSRVLKRMALRLSEESEPIVVVPVRATRLPWARAEGISSREYIQRKLGRLSHDPVDPRRDQPTERQVDVGDDADILRRLRRAGVHVVVIVSCVPPSIDPEIFDNVQSFVTELVKLIELPDGPMSVVLGVAGADVPDALRKGIDGFLQRHPRQGHTFRLEAPGQEAITQWIDLERERSSDPARLQWDALLTWLGLSKRSARRGLYGRGERIRSNVFWIRMAIELVRSAKFEPPVETFVEPVQYLLREFRESEALRRSLSLDALEWLALEDLASREGKREMWDSLRGTPPSWREVQDHLMPSSDAAHGGDDIEVMNFSGVHEPLRRYLIASLVERWIRSNRLTVEQHLPVLWSITSMFRGRDAFVLARPIEEMLQKDGHRLTSSQRGVALHIAAMARFFVGEMPEAPLKALAREWFAEAMARVRQLGQGAPCLVDVAIARECSVILNLGNHQRNRDDPAPMIEFVRGVLDMQQARDGLAEVLQRYYAGPAEAARRLLQHLQAEHTPRVQPELDLAGLYAISQIPGGDRCLLDATAKVPFDTGAMLEHIAKRGRLLREGYANPLSFKDTGLARELAWRLIRTLLKANFSTVTVAASTRDSTTSELPS
jgi:hypothetical protein